jgi:phospholipid-binding lipoprotein MlaA
MNSAVRTGVLAVTLALAGCASTNPKDPFENFNRAMFNFNDKVDQAALKPAAEAYRTLPSFVQTGVGNFFGNLGDVWTSANNLLQGKVGDGMSDFMRFAFNSTFGLLGFLDIASEAGLVKHKEDFGQTLGVWGVAAGPFLVLPLLGPSTVRDTAATPIDLTGDPWDFARPITVRNFGYVARVVDQRAAVLDASNLLEEAALDRYAFVRDAYMQRRESKVRDGGSADTSYEEDDKAFKASLNAAADPAPSTPSGTPVVAAVPQEPAVKPEVEPGIAVGVKTTTDEAGKKQ